MVTFKKPSSREELYAETLRAAFSFMKAIDKLDNCAYKGDARNELDIARKIFYDLRDRCIPLLEEK